MWTTWSFSSRSSALILLTVSPCATRGRPSELQPGRARRLGHGLHTPVIEVAAAVEHRLLQPLRLETLGDESTDLLRRLDVPGGRIALAQLEGRGLRQRDPAPVVDRLDVDVLQAAEHAQPRALRVAREPGADARVALLSRMEPIDLVHHL